MSVVAPLVRPKSHVCVPYGRRLRAEDFVMIRRNEDGAELSSAATTNDEV